MRTIRLSFSSAAIISRTWHFDQGHLEVFRRAPLLIEAGAYEGEFNSTYRLNFYRKTIAHNSILAVDPSVPNDEGGQRIFSNQSEATLESWLANPVNQTGDITDYRDNGYWSYVSGDLSKAYPPARLSRAVREVAWIGDRYLVVVDNLILASSSLRPRILWHYTVKPQVEPGRFTVADKGARATVSVLAPANAVIETVKEYRVGNAYYPPPDPRPSLGIGRVEVGVPASSGTVHEFVQVIDVADTTDVPGAVSLERTAGGLRVTLPVGTLVLDGPAGAREKMDFEPAALDPPGDYDGNGTLGLGDAVYLMRQLFSDPDDPRLDFNSDGRVSLLDILSLLLAISS